MSAEDTPTPPRRSAFGNARKVAERKARAPQREHGSHVLTCPDCGAPREGDTLICRYCSGKTSE